MNANLLADSLTLPTFSIPTPVGGLNGDPGLLISRGITWAVVVALLATVFYILMGGFDYITAGDDAKKVAAARTKITNGVIGLIIVASTWVIFKALAAFVNLGSIFPGF